MVRQWQEMFYDERYSEVYLSPEVPDFVKWAEAMGCVGIRVDSPEEVQPAIDKANSIDDRPVVVDFRVDAREKVFPMVPAGQANDDMILPQCAGVQPGVPAMSTDMNHHILSVLVQNRPGVLARVAGLFARRGFNIFCLAVAPAEDEGFSRITIVVDVDETPLEQITKQLFKLIEVVKISELDPRRSVERELLLATVRGTSPTSAARWWNWSTSSRARSSPWVSRRSPCRSTGTPTSSTTLRNCCPDMASWSSSAPVGWRCPSSIARHACVPSNTNAEEERHGKAG